MLLSWPKFLRLMLAMAAIGLVSPALAETAPEPVGRGPYSVTSAEYKLPAKRDVLVAPFTVTELWARVYRPNDAAGPRPVIVMLHGNHSTCGHFDPALPGRLDDDITYTDTGKCPDGFVVVPSHEGYAYLANQLASWGYYVVSINANRGINGSFGDDGDWGLNLRRGRLVLRHLIQLDRWNTGAGSAKVLGFDLRGHLDFTQIGLFGHSRGGEGVRAALTQYRDIGSIWPSQFRNKPTFRAVFELAPVDGQSDRVLDANDVAWNVLLPTCDGDVSDLEGQKVYDRMIKARAETQPAPKSIFAVEGANHNFYNTEWQQSDSLGCYSGDPAQPVLFDPAASGSDSQRQTALYPVTAFFRANLGSDPAAVFGRYFDPAYRISNRITKLTRFRRTYTDNAARKGSIVLDDFGRPIGGGATGIGNETLGLKYFTQTQLLEHDPALQFGVLAWDRAKNATAFYQADAAIPGAGVSVSAFTTLEFRVGLACKDYDTLGSFGSCEADPALNPSGSTDFSVALVSPDGFLTSPVRLSRYARPQAPVGLSNGPIIINILPGNEPPPGPAGNGHPVLQSVRIPLADFGLKPGTRVRGVRLSFDRAGTGAIYLGNVRFSRLVVATGGPGPGPIPGPRVDAIAPDSGALAVAAARQARSEPAITGGQITRITREQQPVSPTNSAIASTGNSAAANGQMLHNAITIELAVPRPIVIGASLLTLRIGGEPFRLGQAIPAAGQGLRTARFVLTPEAFAALGQGAAVTLENGAQRFNLGALDKALLR